MSETNTRQNSTKTPSPKETRANEPDDAKRGNERRVKIDVPFEEAVKRLLRVPPERKSSEDASVVVE